MSQHLQKHIEAADIAAVKQQKEMEISMRFNILELAIRASAGLTYPEIVEGAKAMETYITGEDA